MNEGFHPIAVGPVTQQVVVHDKVVLVVLDSTSPMSLSFMAREGLPLIEPHHPLTSDNCPSCFTQQQSSR